MVYSIFCDSTLFYRNDTDSEDLNSYFDSKRCHDIAITHFFIQFIFVCIYGIFYNRIRTTLISPILNFFMLMSTMDIVMFYIGRWTIKPGVPEIVIHLAVLFSLAQPLSTIIFYAIAGISYTKRVQHFFSTSHSTVETHPNIKLINYIQASVAVSASLVLIAWCHLGIYWIPTVAIANAAILALYVTLVIRTCKMISTLPPYTRCFRRRRVSDLIFPHGYNEHDARFFIIYAFPITVLLMITALSSFTAAVRIYKGWTPDETERLFFETLFYILSVVPIFSPVLPLCSAAFLNSMSQPVQPSARERPITVRTPPQQFSNRPSFSDNPPEYSTLMMQNRPPPYTETHITPENI